MYNVIPGFLSCVLLCGLFKSHVSIPITSWGQQEGGNKLKERQCKPVDDCDFYKQFENKDIPTELKNAIEKEIIREACGLNVNLDVDRGKRNQIVLLALNDFDDISF